MRSNLLSLSSILAVALCCAVTSQADPPEVEHGRPEIIPHPRNPNANGSGQVTVGSTKTMNPAIRYHGGPVMTGSPTVYVIWYGDWAQANNSDNLNGQNIVRAFLGAIGGSPYLRINTTYSIPGSTISGNVTVGPEKSYGAYLGTSLSDSQIGAIVQQAITDGLPKDSNGVYFVLTSSDVTASSGFCTQYCGWHTYGTIAGTDIKYSFVGNAKRCLSACAAQTVGPNGNAGVDAMISVIAHELEEAISDPDLNAWWDLSGYENADKCAWTFGTAQFSVNSTTDTGGAATATANVTLGGKPYLIQRNLLHGIGKGDICAISFTPPNAYVQ